MERISTCCFTGHRPEKLPWGNHERDPRCLALKQRIQDAVRTAYAGGMRHFISGMARGTDLYFCAEVLALRAQHPDITIEAAIPFPGQAERWSDTDRALYDTLLAQCDFETVVQHQYSPGCMQRRNRYLVDRSALLIAVYHGQSGGTLYTISYALREGLETMILDL